MSAPHTRTFLALLPAVLIGVLGAGCADGPAAPPAGPPSFSTAGVEGAGAPGSIVFHSDRAGNREIYALSPGGSDPVRLTNDAASDYYPDISSNGRFVAYSSKAVGATKADIMLLDLRTGKTSNLTASAGADDDWARFSPNGQQLAYHSNVTGNYEIYVLDLATRTSTQVTNYAGADMWPDWSPNGKQLAIRRNTDVYLLDLASGAATQLTTDAALDQMAAWSPDGRHIAFMSQRAEQCSVFLMNADGSDQVNLTPRPAGDAASAWCSRAPSWTRNGEILFMSIRPAHAGNAEVYIMNPDGSGVTRLTESAGEDGGPRAR